MRKTSMLVVLVLTLACSSSSFAPQVVVDETVCAACSMLVSDLAFAAALRMPDGSERAFDDPACLVKYVRSAKATTPKEVWFHDHAGDGWAHAANVVFVKHDGVRGPMGGRVIAMFDQREAARIAAANGGSVISSYDELLRSEAAGK